MSKTAFDLYVEAHGLAAACKAFDRPAPPATPPKEIYDLSEQSAREVRAFLAKWHMSPPVTWRTLMEICYMRGYMAGQSDRHNKRKRSTP